MFKKTVIIISAMIAMSSQAMAFFSDVPINHPYETAINYLEENGIINGYSDGSFRPENPVNRAEFLKIIIEGSNINTDKNLSSPFYDVDQDAWYANYVNKAYHSGWVIGYSDGNFRPEQTINKAEALKILSKVQNWYLSTPVEKPYLDISTNDWYSLYFAYAKNFDLLPNISTNAYPATLMSRGEISEIIYRTIVPKDERTAVTTETNDTQGSEKIEESPDIEINYETIPANSFSNISLISSPPKSLFKDEIFIIEGEVKSGNYDEVTMIIQNTKSKTQEVMYAETDSNRFRIPLHFDTEGNYAFGIFPGNSGTTNIEEIKVTSLPQIPMKSTATPPQTQVSLTYKKDSTSISLSGNTPQYLKKFRFEQNGTTRTYISRQNITDIPLNYKDFQNFNEGSVKLETYFASISSLNPLTITGDFSKGHEYNFTAAEHTFITNEKDEISTNPEITQNSVSKISFSGKALTKLRKTAYVQKPDGFVEEVLLSTTENSDILSPGSSFTFNYTPKNKGRYLVEINNNEAIASLNTPIYIGGIIPLIPDFQDLNERSYFKGSLDLEKNRITLLNLINEFRQSHGLSAVNTVSELNSLAQNHSQDMAQNNFFGHINPDGLSPDQRRIAAGISTPVSENLAKDVSIEFAHYGLLRSPAHRLNIMNSNWTSVGLGIAEKDGYLYISQEFAAPKITSSDTAKFEKELFTEINLLRAENNLTPLILDLDLSGVGASINYEVVENGQTLNNELFSNSLKDAQISGHRQSVECIMHGRRSWIRLSKTKSSF